MTKKKRRGIPSTIQEASLPVEWGNYTALVLFAVLGVMMFHCWALCSAFWLVIVSAALGFFTFKTFAPVAIPAPKVSASAAEIGLAAILVIFQCLLFYNPTIFYPTSMEALDPLIAILGVTVVLSVVIALLVILKAKSGNRVPEIKALAVLMVLLLVAAHILVLVVSPHPLIDVFTISTEATDKLLQGHNPYGLTYTEIYNGYYGYRPVFCYPPGLLYFFAAARYLFGDIRAAYVASGLGSVICLYLMAAQLKLSNNLKCLFALAWYSSPVTLFVLEQAWTDSLLIFFVALACLALLKERWWLAGLFLGFEMTMKQYGFLFCLFVILGLWFRRKKQESGRVALAAVLTALLLMLPFVLTQPKGFMDDVFVYILQQKLRTEAFTWPAYLMNQWKYAIPSWLYLVIPLTALLGIGWTMRTRIKLSQWMSGIAVFHGILFLFAKQAFCNYYYYLSFIVLLSRQFEQSKVEQS